MLRDVFRSQMGSVSVAHTVIFAFFFLEIFPKLVVLSSEFGQNRIQIKTGKELSITKCHGVNE